MGLLHEVGNELLSEHHNVVRFDLKWHPALTDLPINKKLAPLIFERVFFLEEALRNLLHLCLPQSCKLIKYGIDNHLNDFVLVELVRLLKNILFLLVTFQVQNI